MESINIIYTAASNLMDKINQPPSSPIVPRSSIITLEEEEREQRLIHPAQAKISRDNAARLSSLVSQSQRPFSLQPGHGFKRITRKLEDVERERRERTRAEYSLRRSNSSKVAGMIKGLGWPFFQYDEHRGVEFIFTDPTSLMEEEERAYRLSDPLFVMTAKNNGAIVSTLIRWNGVPKLSKSKRYTRSLEETERKRRIQTPLEAEWASYNALMVSTKIRNLGWPFFQQQSTTDKLETYESTHHLEEEERKRRMGAGDEQQLAREIAGRVSHMLPLSSDIAAIEEEEKERRMMDESGEKTVRAHAKYIANMIAPNIAEIEERERTRRIQHDEEGEQHARREANLIKYIFAPEAHVGLDVSRDNIVALEERERERRVQDYNQQFISIRLARKASDIFMAGFAEMKRSIPLSLTENERQRQMYDRPGQLLAIRNARKVAGIISNRHQLQSQPIRRASFVEHEEESERARRLADVPSQMMVRSNAGKISGLIPTSRLQTTPMNLPSSPMPCSPMDAHVPFIPAPPTLLGLSIGGRNLSPTPMSYPAVSSTDPAPAPLVKAKAASVVQTASDPSLLAAAGNNHSPAHSLTRPPPGFSQQPQYAPPGFSQLHQRCPPRTMQHSVSAPNLFGMSTPQQRNVTLSSALFSSVPIAGAPVPVSGESLCPLPVRSSPPPTPTPSTPTYNAAGVQIRSALKMSSPAAFEAPRRTVGRSNSVTFAPLPTELSNPSFGPQVQSVPIYQQIPLPLGDAYPSTNIIAPVPSPGLNEREQRRLERIAAKHAKTASKESRKATKDLAKAVQLHSRGKGERALRLQTRAEQHNVAAKHHMSWAKDLQKDVVTPFSPIMTAGRPSM